MPPSAVNTPPVNTPAINTSGSETPLVAIKPGLGLEGQDTAVTNTLGESSLQAPSSVPFATSPLATQSESAAPAESQPDALAAGPVSAETVEEVGTNDTVPDKADDGGNMQVEADQREYDTNMVPELQGAEAEQTRIVLGKHTRGRDSWHSGVS